MTQAMSQIGKALLLEFVKMCEERNVNSMDRLAQARGSTGIGTGTSVRDDGGFGGWWRA